MVRDPAARPDADELRRAAELAAHHQLTFYDAAYAAVADNRGATLATLNSALLDTDLGSRPSELARQLYRAADEGSRRKRPRQGPHRP